MLYKGCSKPGVVRQSREQPYEFEASPRCTVRSYLETPRGVGARRNALGGTVSRTDTRSEAGSIDSVFTLALDTKPTDKAVKSFESHLVFPGCSPSPVHQRPSTRISRPLFAFVLVELCLYVICESLSCFTLNFKEVQSVL